MTTLQPTLGNAFKMRLAGLLVKSAEQSEQVKRARTWVQSLIRFVMHAAGFSSLTYAAFLWHIIAGFVVLGIACFMLAPLATPKTQQPQSPPQRMR